MRFRIRSNDYDIDMATITTSLQNVTPKPTDSRNKHFVEIDGITYPIKQPIHEATGLPYVAYHAQDAYRILDKLGFEIRDVYDDIPPEKLGGQNELVTKFPVILETDEDGNVVATCPVLPGCHSQGKSKSQAIDNITEAIRGYVVSMRKHDESIPVAVVTEVEVAI